MPVQQAMKHTPPTGLSKPIFSETATESSNKHAERCMRLRKQTSRSHPSKAVILLVCGVFPLLRKEPATKIMPRAVVILRVTPHLVQSIRYQGYIWTAYTCVTPARLSRSRNVTPGGGGAGSHAPSSSAEHWRTKVAQKVTGNPSDDDKPRRRSEKQLPSCPAM